MRKALTALPGVRHVDVKSASATVTIEEGKVTGEQIVSEVEKLGFGWSIAP